MGGFTKLVPEIVESSIWNESSDVRIVWITMLATKDENGYVRGDARTISRSANVPVEAVEEALALFQQPDKGSFTPDNDGRRIAPFSGGWIVLNHEVYRAKDDIKREQTRLRVRKYRDKVKSEDNVTQGNVTQALPSVSVSVSASSSEKGESEGDRRNRDFEECWKLYPKKDGKPQAHKAYNKHKPKKEDVIAGIKRYIAYVEAERKTGFDRRYANGSTWFNQQCWESEYEIDGAKSKSDPERTRQILEGFNAR